MKRFVASILALATCLLPVSVGKAEDFTAFEINLIRLLTEGILQAEVDGRETGTAGLLNFVDWQVDYHFELTLAGSSVTCGQLVDSSFTDEKPCRQYFRAQGQEFAMSVHVPMGIVGHAKAKADYPGPGEASGSVDPDLNIGLRVVLPFNRGPLGGAKPAFEDTRVAIAREGGSVNVNGLTSELVTVGAALGKLSFSLGGAIPTALLAWFSADEVEREISKSITGKFDEALRVASDEATAALQQGLSEKGPKVVGKVSALTAVAVLHNP